MSDLVEKGVGNLASSSRYTYLQWGSLGQCREREREREREISGPAVE